MPVLLNSFKNSAKKIGNGNPIIKSPIFKINVFFTANQNSLDPNASLKYLKPTHGDSQIPLKMLYFLNATTMYSIGLYLKQISQIIGINIITYSCQVFLRYVFQLTFFFATPGVFLFAMSAVLLFFIVSLETFHI